MCFSVYIGKNECLLLAECMCVHRLCVCVSCVRALVLSCSLFVLKVRGIAEIESNLKDTALEQAPLQMDPLR